MNQKFVINAQNLTGILKTEYAIEDFDVHNEGMLLTYYYVYVMRAFFIQA